MIYQVRIAIVVILWGGVEKYLEGDLCGGGGPLDAANILFLDLSAVNTVCENLSSCTLRNIWMLGMELHPHSLYVEALPPYMIVFGDGPFQEVIKVKGSNKGGTLIQ